MKNKNLSWFAALLVFALLLWCTAATPGKIADPSTYTCAVYSTIFSLLPPVIAIVLALNTKEVYTSLLVGIASGALLYANGNLELAINTLFFNEDGGMVAKLSDSSNVGILVFLVMLGILVALMNKAGGSAAFGRWASTHIHSRAGAQFATLLLGVMIFVDDYFNCLTVGSVMRPVTDRQKVSRAKLAYLIDALLRKNEKEEVCSVFGPGNANGFDINFICVDARERYFAKLAGVTEPERKRKIIGEEFIRVFEEQAKKIGKVDFLAQGTIYPDVVESGLGGESTVIKSHHNVGGLPDTVDFKELVEPLRNLFKDEVRQAGRELGLPEYLVSRQPFPGPGLGIRIIGEVTPEKVAIVQDADAIWREEIAKAGLDKEISQYYAALTNMHSVGVMGDERTYDYAVALRAVTTTDFMTAESYNMPWDVLGTVTSRIVNEVKHVNRVFYDCTGKPPATIELE